MADMCINFHAFVIICTIFILIPLTKTFMWFLTKASTDSTSKITINMEPSHIRGQLNTHNKLKITVFWGFSLIIFHTNEPKVDKTFILFLEIGICAIALHTKWVMLFMLNSLFSKKFC